MRRPTIPVLTRARTFAVVAVLTVIALLGLGSVALASTGTSAVDQPRLERSLAAVFAQRYVAQARLLGHDRVSADSLHAAAMCDKHGPEVADVGPGGDWVCLMSWDDPDVPMPTEGYGKFELNVHSNACYTVSAPSKLTGFLTMTDTRGREVDNPVFEFDGCFDPHGDDTPTGTTFPSLLTVTTTTLTPNAEGDSSVTVTCGTGSDGCSDTIAVSADGRSLGNIPVDLAEEATATLPLPSPVPAGARTVELAVSTDTGVGPNSPTSLRWSREPTAARRLTTWSGAAGIGAAVEYLPVGVDVGPVVPVVAQGEVEHPEVVVLEELRPGSLLADLVERLAAGPDHGLASPFRGPGHGVAGDVEAVEPLVAVVMGGKVEVDAGVDEDLPQRLEEQLGAVGPGGPAGVVHRDRDARGGVRGKVGGEIGGPTTRERRHRVARVCRSPDTRTRSVSSLVVRSQWAAPDRPSASWPARFTGRVADSNQLDRRARRGPGTRGRRVRDGCRRVRRAGRAAPGQRHQVGGEQQECLADPK